MITKFRGQHSWLSNMTECTVIYGGEEYASVEHAYFAQKSNDYGWKDFCKDVTNPPNLIKRCAKTVKSVDNWHDINLQVMEECLRSKFSFEPYRSKLIATGEQTIMEGNWWNDHFWGVDHRTLAGKNHLGKLIMKIREELQ